MALFFTLAYKTKFSLGVVFFAVLSITNLTAQNYTSNKAGSSTIVNNQMQWVYGGYRFTWEIPLDVNAYNYYKEQSKKNSYATYAQEHANFPYLSQLAKTLKVDADELGYTGWKLAEYLTAFVQQNIIYTKDPYNNGADYPKFPIETLVEKKGDCEDSAILLVSLLKLFGFDALLIQVPRHMAVGIACSNCSFYYSFEGRKYAYIETTNPKWKIGSIPSEHKKSSAQLIKTPFIRYFNKNNYAYKLNNQVKTFTFNRKSYTIQPNKTIDIEVDGLKISIKN